VKRRSGRNSRKNLGSAAWKSKYVADEHHLRSASGPIWIASVNLPVGLEHDIEDDAARALETRIERISNSISDLSQKTNIPSRRTLPTISTSSSSFNYVLCGFGAQHIVLPQSILQDAKGFFARGHAFCSPSRATQLLSHKLGGIRDIPAIDCGHPAKNLLLRRIFAGGQEAAVASSFRFKTALTCAVS